ncbi:MAG: S41 family peptidase, partial [Planctomycetota bacterium]|nr:S41 family peptidase [Planctomycetota bacterium]
GHFGGLGIFITLEQGLVSVIAPLEGTPAAQAGLLPGDLILRINDEKYSFQSTAEAVSVLKGEPKTDIKLQVLHKGSKTPFEVTLQRDIITVESVRDIKLVDPINKIGYMRIIAFQGDTASEVAKAMVALVEQGAKSVILDLRTNPGGLLRTATKICDFFLAKEKLIVRTKSRDKEDVPMYSEDDPYFEDMPVAVLIDEGSASASEILAGALRDHQQAVLVGMRSYGKGSVQSVIDLMDGKTLLKLTTAYYYTPSGRRIHRRKDSKPEDEWGLVPDIKVPLTLEQKAKLAEYQNKRYVLSLKERAGKKLSDKDKVEEFKDPVVEAAVAHLAKVLTKKAPLIPEGAVPPEKSSEKTKKSAPTEQAKAKEKQ